MKKITNILLKILDCITLKGIVEKPKETEGERHASIQKALEMHRNGELNTFPAVYKLDNGDYDVFIRINGEDVFGYCGHVIESNEPKNYPVGRYSKRWNLNNMSKVIDYGE
jgi:hypothetical protein